MVRGFAAEYRVGYRLPLLDLAPKAAGADVNGAPVANDRLAQSGDSGVFLPGLLLGS